MASSLLCPVRPLFSYLEYGSIVRKELMTKALGISLFHGMSPPSQQPRLGPDLERDSKTDLSSQSPCVPFLDQSRTHVRLGPLWYQADLARQ